MVKHELLYLLWFTFLLVLGNSVVKTSCSSGSGNSGCYEDERQALIKFKQYSTDEDPFGKLAVSWNGTECCQWYGVECDGVTGHVIKLDLRFDHLTQDHPYLGFREMSTSLSELKHLSYLDVSGNYFGGGEIPEFIGSMKQLTYLNLSNSGFRGLVPHSLGNLSNLRALDLSWTGSFHYYLEADDLKWVSRLSSLERLSMIGVNLSRARNVDKVLSRIPSFIYLTLSNCGLDNTHLPHPHESINSTSTSSRTVKIQHLDLSRNLFQGEFPPPFLRNITTSLLTLDLSHNSSRGEIIEPSHTDVNIYDNLEMLVLSENQFNGSIPEVLCKMKALVHLDLSGNRLSGNLPRCLQDLQQLRVLMLGSNMLSGELIIPSSFGANRACSLEELSLIENRFQGELPLGLGECGNLTVLSLRRNRLSGSIPEWLGEKLTRLRILHLGTNNFSGSIPQGLCQVPWLQYLNISSNNLTGTIPRCFGFCSGQVTGQFRSFAPYNWYQDFANHYKEFNLGSVGLVRFSIDFSQNNLAGNIPGELTVLQRLSYLNLSHNHLNGPIPDNIGDLKGDLRELDLSHNYLSGTIPDKNIGDLKNLGILDLSHNNLSGTIPANISSMISLHFLDLSYNKLWGRIPSELAFHFSESSYYSSYDGNPDLCGFPLPQKCQSDDSSQIPKTRIKEGENEANKVWLYWGMVCGFAMGFLAVIGLLVLNKRWRHALFQHVEVAVDRFLLDDKAN